MPKHVDENIEHPDDETTEEEEVETSEEETQEEEIPEEEETPETPDDTDDPKTPRERRLMDKARSEEKSKLYNEMKKLKARLRELETASKETEEVPIKPKKKDDELTKLMDMVSSLQNQIKSRDTQSSLEKYRSEKIAEAEARGDIFVDSLVFGNSEEEIDLSMEVAKAEAALLLAKQRVPSRTNTSTAPRRTVVVKQGGKTPQGVPPTPNRRSRSDDDRSGGYTVEQLRDLTSDEAMRSGNYAQNRQKILDALRHGRVRT